MRKLPIISFAYAPVFILSLEYCAEMNFDVQDVMNFGYNGIKFYDPMECLQLIHFLFRSVDTLAIRVDVIADGRQFS